MEGDSLRKLRHDLRGRWHALSLCLCALDVVEDPTEQAEMLDLLAKSAEEVDGVLLQMLQLPDSATSSASI